MNNINKRLDQSNIFYELDNLVLFEERTEIEMDFLTPEGKVKQVASNVFNNYEQLMDSWTPNAKESLKKGPEAFTSPSYDELLDFVSFDSTPPKSLDKGLKDRATTRPDAAIVGSTLLTTSVFFAILALLSPHTSALFILYSVLSATASASGGALLLTSTVTDKFPYKSYNPIPKDLF